MSASAEDKRTAPRVVVKLPVVLKVVQPPQDKDYQASTLNISEAGIAISTQFYLPEGCTVEMSMTFPEGGTLPAVGRVMWATKLNQFSVIPNFAIGVSFDDLSEPLRGVIRNLVKLDRKKIKR